jgi:hypothetical protein
LTRAVSSRVTTYYYSGMINRPDGIIGIAAPYTLRTTLRKEKRNRGQIYFPE